jgi:hypothetical protein
MRDKVGDEVKTFSPEETVSMAHGFYDEHNIACKVGKALGCDIQLENWLVVSDRWEYLGASIDGFISPNADAVPSFEFYQDEAAAIRLRAQLEAYPVPLIHEIKKSLSRAWAKGIPEYYQAQLQTQMHILDIPAAVISAECVSEVKHTNDYGRYYTRRYWDVKSFLLERDPAWVAVLDKVNEEFAEEYKEWL